MERNYVIFGGSGFVGTHLARLIAERDPQGRVWNLDSVSPEAIPQAIAEGRGSWASVRGYSPALAPGERHPATWVECDVRRPIGELPFAPGPDDVVVNLAAIHRTPGHADADYWETNVRGAENVCAWAGRHGIRRMVLASSISVYGTSEALKTEESPLDASAPYGASKIEAERISTEWALREKETTDGHGLTRMNQGGDDTSRCWGRGTTDGHGLTRINDEPGITESQGEEGTTDGHGLTRMQAGSLPSQSTPPSQSRSLLIVRPGVVFGKGENGNFSRLYRAIRGWRFAYPGRKDTIKAAIYVKELAEFIWWHIHQGRTGVEVYNCTVHPALTIEQICEAMKRATGLRRPILDIPNWLIMPAAAVIGAMGAPMGICPARVRKLQVSTNISGERLAASGYQMRYTFGEALADWWHDNDGGSLS